MSQACFGILQLVVQKRNSKHGSKCENCSEPWVGAGTVRHRHENPQDGVRFDVRRYVYVVCFLLCTKKLNFDSLSDVNAKKNIVPFFWNYNFEILFQKYFTKYNAKKKYSSFFFWNYNFEILFQKCFTKYNAKKNIVPFFWNYNFEIRFQKYFTKYNAQKKYRSFFFGTIILKSFFKNISPNIMPKKNIVPFFLEL